MPASNLWNFAFFCLSVTLLDDVQFEDYPQNLEIECRILLIYTVNEKIPHYKCSNIEIFSGITYLDLDMWECFQIILRWHRCRVDRRPHSCVPLSSRCLQRRHRHPRDGYQIQTEISIQICYWQLNSCKKLAFLLQILTNWLKPSKVLGGPPKIATRLSTRSSFSYF